VDMNKRSGISTIIVNRHEKMGAFKSQSLCQPTSIEGSGERSSLFFHMNILPLLLI
jgi:hypothetical protein